MSKVDRLIGAALANDETSSDDELTAYFQKEVGLSRREAERIVEARGEYLYGSIM